MTDSEKVSEIILNMKFKTSIFGGVTKESVYENIRSLCAYYDEEMRKLQKKAEEVDQQIASLNQKHEQDMQALKKSYIQQVQAHQRQLTGLIRQFSALDEEMSRVAGEYADPLQEQAQKAAENDIPNLAQNEAQNSEQEEAKDSELNVAVDMELTVSDETESEPDLAEGGESDETKA